MTPEAKASEEAKQAIEATTTPNYLALKAGPTGLGDLRTPLYRSFSQN